MIENAISHAETQDEEILKARAEYARLEAGHKRFATRSISRW